MKVRRRKQIIYARRLSTRLVTLRIHWEGGHHIPELVAMAMQAVASNALKKVIRHAMRHPNEPLPVGVTSAPLRDDDPVHPQGDEA